MWKKPPWLARTRPAPWQVWQVFGLVPGFDAGARAEAAGDGRRHLDLDGFARIGFLERDLEIVAKVGAALAAAAAPSAAAEIAKELVKNVGEGGEA